MTDPALSELQDRLTKLEEAAGADSYGTTNNYFINEKEATKILEEIEALLGPIYKLMIASPASNLTGVNPVDVAVSPDGLNVYVINEEARTITVFERNEETGQLTLLETVAAHPGLDWKNIVCSPNGNEVFVVSNFGAGLGNPGILSQFMRGAKGALQFHNSVALEAQYGRNIKVSRDGKLLYVHSEGHLQVFNPELELLQTIPFAAEQETAYTAETSDEKYVLALDQKNSQVVVFLRTEEAAPLVEHSKHATLAGPYGGIVIDPTDKFVYLLHIGNGAVEAEIAQFTLAKGELTPMSPAAVQFGAREIGPATLAIRPDGRGIYCTGAGTLHEMPITRLSGAVNAAFHEVILNVAETRGLAFSPDGKNCYVCSRESKELFCLAAQ